MSEKHRILVIEDNENDFLLIKTAFNKMPENFDLLRATKFDEIKDYLLKEISLVICDFNLKSFTAEDVLDYMNQVDCKIPMIIISGTIGDEYAAHVTKKGAVDYILKDNFVRLHKAVTREIASFQSRKQTHVLEDKVKKIQEQLIHLQKMDGYSKMAGGLAHDFNNLLTVMRINLMFLRKACQPEQFAVIQKLLDAESKATKITEKLLAISKMNFGNAKHNNANEICQELRDVIKSQLESSVELVEQYEDGELGVFIDRANLEQIILNLVLNAYDSLGGHGIIIVSTRKFCITEDYQLLTNSLKPGEYVIIEVQDNGKGIPSDRLKFFFDPFYTTKEFAKSNGLGLSVVYGLVHQSNGAIDVQSEVGVGTTVQVFFPLSYEELKEVERPAAPAVAENRELLLKKIKTVLLVDDSIDLNAIFESLLQSYGLKVLPAYNINEAKKVLEENKHDINLILSDMVMPNGTGLDFLKWVREKGYQQHFIIMSGYLSDIVAYKDVESLQVVFLEKPFSEDSFFEKLSLAFKESPQIQAV